MATNKPFSFWQFLSKYNSVIPIIQRDYAQGRKGKETLRKEFFGQLIDSLKGIRSLKLDFVYGCTADANEVPGSIVYPLDGQQRLTTLWLLHWYLAFKKGLLNKRRDDEVISTLKKFSYQIRTSSRQFCQRMCEEIPVDVDYETVVQMIRDQSWFTRRYKEDPTINAMLRSLNDQETQSGFQNMIQDDDVDSFWEKLISDNCPVKFYFKDTRDADITNPDDLYIKMNARGKKLTDFENFKAELFSFKTPKVNGCQIFREDKANGFTKKFDNSWSNLFWPLRDKRRNVIDYIFFEFFNRMALNFLIEKELFSDDKESELNILYNHITEHKEFSTIENYRPVLEWVYKDENSDGPNSEYILAFREYFSNVMDGIVKVDSSGVRINQLITDALKAQSSFSYIPIYGDEKSGKGFFSTEYKNEKFYVSETTVRGQVISYGASHYFAEFVKNSNSIFSQIHFMDWMIFVRNLFDNSGIDTYQNASSIVKFIRSFGEHCFDIIPYLSSAESTGIIPSGDRLKKQYSEEREKAAKIQLFRERKNEIKILDYETLIRDAESQIPTHGNISFLFQNEHGKYDWSNFKTKYDNFLEIIDQSKNKSASTNRSFWDDDKYIQTALRSLLQYVTDWGGQMGSICYNSSFESWKQILNNPKWTEAVHNLLFNGIQSDKELQLFQSSLSNSEEAEGHTELVASKLLHQTTWGDFYMKPAEFRLYIWRSSVEWKTYIFCTPRNKLITYGIYSAKIIDRIRVEIPDLESNRLLGDREHLWGINFFFELEDMKDSPYVFWWHSSRVRRHLYRDKRDMDVYLCLRNEKDHPYFNKNNPEEFGVAVPLNCNFEDFVLMLRNLIKKADSSSAQSIPEGK